MDAITLNEFKKILARQKYKYIQMVDSSGQTLVPWNTSKASASQRLDEMYKRLETQSDNYFIIRAKNSMAGKVKPDEWYIVKEGTTLSQNAPVTVPIQVIERKSPNVSDDDLNVRSYANVLDLEIKLKAQELENDRLNDKIEELEEKLAAYEESEHLGNNQEQELFGQNTQTWLSNTFEMLTPIIDRHYQIKEQQIKLETIRLMRANGHAPAQVPQQPAAQPVGGDFDEQMINLLNEKIQGYISQFTEDPEIYEPLVQIYNTAESIDHFLDTLKKQSPEHFVALNNFINGREN
jgi:hypothetical protein